ncbi:molybdopterin molybdotransferase MoeA [Cloacibacillus sp. An23]|uniref:molybdopterin molybdotransferase MoeA n=1 Tax=Cloacibacillus sp. An23 TaxID=1965591 RepID=UPI0013024293|nr:molybdopterin molybdotransferase MoeA [Cloacibacillus sp. An23]
MAGFVKEVAPREAALDEIEKRLAFPWNCKKTEVALRGAAGRRCAEAVTSPAPYPPFRRSLRDGYAVNHMDAAGATPGTPLFLSKKGEVKMGEAPGFTLSLGEACPIPTGGMLPDGADAVVMLEDTSEAGGWVEIRRGVQGGENVIGKGEEVAEGEELLPAGSLVDFRTVSVLAAIGAAKLPVHDIKISILSTGDEIVPAEEQNPPLGAVRDVNGWSVGALLSRFGFPAEYRGIVSDDGAEFERRFRCELAACDVLILSGGSSVGVRDHCSRLFESLPEPGLLVRGINIAPGKPTLIAADAAARKLAVSLPGHPLSCFTVGFTVLLPLLLRLIGADERECWTRTLMPLACDLAARTGPEEFFPCSLNADGTVSPLAAKSGYISILSGACGFIRIPEDRETARAGEYAEVWLWR